eukprot:CAMPEP_0182428456 /NCGR_PEP_ID=MMETSP1167-20130531/23041_1 /TAXON_ID=2988 /ORGANISM="Mallomonas Sp, Strain CCMP3275" /LENGTH=476 /DNA_ID=CAMNT_0024611391 /DNA_START=368 /DNA_END=1798 /DNA_ORIENTATION=+
MAPIIYTPTVGLACQQFSGVFRQPRGMYFSIDHKDECLPMVYNWPANEVDIIVVTDGSRILGLGDLGVQGIGISIGKLVLYVAGAGINPRRALPIVIDVGTNNESLLNSDLYLGLSQPRCDDTQYYELMDEFMTAVHVRWPNVLIQFEDFQNERAVKLLEKYREKYLCFNDDIQGTGAMTVAGLMCGLRSKGLDVKDLMSQKIVVAGAGSAGIGVVQSITMAMKRLGATDEEAQACFWILDREGVLTRERETKDLLPGQREYLRPEREQEGLSILEIVRTVKPQILLGLSGTSGIFTDEVLTEMGRINEQPIIFPMSNPSSKAECTAETAFRCTEGRAIFASGSPFDDVTLSNGRLCKANQANNMFIFPGLGQGAILGKCHKISDDMLMEAAETLAKFIPSEDAKLGVVYPSVSDIREVSINIATAVIIQAQKENNIQNNDLISKSPEEIQEYVVTNMYEPGYSTLVYSPQAFQRH